MSIDYAVQFPCNIRRQIPEPKLRTMIKHRDTAAFAIETFRRAEPGIDPKTLVQERMVSIQVRMPDGTEKEQPVPIGALLSTSAPLEELKGHCTQCRANLTGQPYGCFGKVNYPIEKTTEEWLVARLPADGKDGPLKLLFKFVADLDITGAPVDANRARPDLFEARSAALRTWKNWLSSQQLNSSQLIHMLAYGGNLGAEQARLYTHLLNLTIDHTDMPLTRGIAQFKAFLRAVVLSGRLDAPLTVDA